MKPLFTAGMQLIYGSLDQKKKKSLEIFGFGEKRITVLVGAVISLIYSFEWMSSMNIQREWLSSGLLVYELSYFMKEVLIYTFLCYMGVSILERKGYLKIPLAETARAVLYNLLLIDLLWTLAYPRGPYMGISKFEVLSVYILWALLIPKERKYNKAFVIEDVGLLIYVLGFLYVASGNEYLALFAPMRDFFYRLATPVRFMMGILMTSYEYLFSRISNEMIRFTPLGMTRFFLWHNEMKSRCD